MCSGEKQWWAEGYPDKDENSLNILDNNSPQKDELSLRGNSLCASETHIADPYLCGDNQEVLDEITNRDNLNEIQTPSKDEEIVR